MGLFSIFLVGATATLPATISATGIIRIDAELVLIDAATNLDAAIDRG